MSNQSPRRKFSRRDFLKIGGGAVAAAAGARLLPSVASRLAQTAQRVEAAAPQVNLHLAATDGFISMPGSVPPFHPDPLAPAPFTNWGFGFRDVTGLSATQVQDQLNKFQNPAPMLWADELDDVRITLTNLGLAMRPDLTDGHTIHFHGFRNAIPFFDGVPELSVSVPGGREFTYFYRPRDPGTYMYHCHFEDVEHVSMGMTGIIFVRPAQNKTPLNPGEQYAYNDGNGLTRFDREFGLILGEMWAEERYRGVHIQEHDWSEYRPDFWLLNGRAYPDTIAPNGPGRDSVTGDLLPTPGYEHLQYQPMSSLVTANAGDQVLLRFVNLGFQQHAMTLDGIRMRVVGKDATLLRGRDGADLSYETNTVYIGPGESADAIFTAPAVTTQTTYLLYNRNYAYLHNAGVSGLGGQMTEVRIYPAGTLPAQTTPNT